MLELGYAYLSSLELPAIAQPHLEVLASQVHESCSVCILDGVDIVYVARVPTRRIMTVAISVGTRFPAYATSMGRVLLAAQPAQWLEEYLAASPFPALTERTITDSGVLRRALDQTRSDGFALVDQELETALRSLAVPIHGPTGQVVAAMNISVHALTGEIEHTVAALLPPLLEAVARVESDLRVGS